MSVKDFDKAWDEKDEEGYPFKVLGREYELPPSVPASIMLEALNLKKEYGDEDELPPEKTIDLAIDMLGKEQVDQMLDDGLSADQLGDIIVWANQQYSAEEVETDEEEDGSGK